MNHGSNAARASRPEPAIQRQGWLDDLARRSIRLATIVQAASRRRDVRELRTKLLLLLFGRRCPSGGTIERAWYVPGAVARTGIEAIQRIWRESFDEQAPSDRTLYSHLGLLERCGAIARRPGDWIPTRADGPRLRHPDTIYLLDDERDALWWTTEGAAIYAREPAARTNPTLWRRLFRDWRKTARDPQPRLPFPEGPLPTAAPAHRLEEQRSAAAELGRATGDPVALLVACRRAGAHLEGRPMWELARDGRRLRAAMDSLAHELAKGTRIRNRAGWLVWAFRAARI